MHVSHLSYGEQALQKCVKLSGTQVSHNQRSRALSNHGYPGEKPFSFCLEKRADNSALQGHIRGCDV